MYRNEPSNSRLINHWFT